MKSIWFAAILAIAAGAAFAQSGADVVKAKGCLNELPRGGREEDGDSFKDISAKHKGDKDAQAKLTAKSSSAKRSSAASRPAGRSTPRSTATAVVRKSSRSNGTPFQAAEGRFNDNGDAIGRPRAFMADCGGRRAWSSLDQ